MSRESIISGAAFIALMAMLAWAILGCVAGIVLVGWNDQIVAVLGCPPMSFAFKTTPHVFMGTASSVMALGLWARRSRH